MAAMKPTRSSATRAGSPPDRREAAMATADTPYEAPSSERAAAAPAMPRIAPPRLGPTTRAADSESSRRWLPPTSRSAGRIVAR